MGTVPNQVFHVADARNWPSVEREGLCSTTALSHRVPEALRRKLHAFRAGGVHLEGVAPIRDQAPMPPASLARCLDPGLTPADWYQLLNGFVFFWAQAERAQRHLQAMGDAPQVLLRIDTNSLVQAHLDRVFVTPFNVEAARRRPASRGLRTIVPWVRWQRDGWAAEARREAAARPASHPVAELLIRDHANDVLNHVICVEQIENPRNTSSHHEHAQT